MLFLCCGLACGLVLGLFVDLLCVGLDQRALLLAEVPLPQIALHVPAGVLGLGLGALQSLLQLCNAEVEDIDGQAAVRSGRAALGLVDLGLGLPLATLLGFGSALLLLGHLCWSGIDLELNGRAWLRVQDFFFFKDLFLARFVILHPVWVYKLDVALSKDGAGARFGGSIHREEACVDK